MNDAIFSFLLFGESSSASSYLGLAIAAFVITAGIRQFLIQYDKLRQPERYFEQESARAQKFLKRQALRRIQLAVLIFLFGVLMAAGLFLSNEAHPQAWGIVWTAALFILLWSGCLALVDVLSIKMFYSADLDKQRAEKLALDYKMKKFQEKSLRDLDEAKEEASRDEQDKQE